MPQDSLRVLDSKDMIPTPNSHISPVEWQTVCWILIALAMNTMAQPAGRVCGISSRYRTYARCSPIVCAADMVSIVTRLLITCFYLRTSPVTALRMLKAERYKDVEPIEGIRVIEQYTWLRWVYFILGALPQAIKLMSFRGTPWTQVVGLIFLVSFIIVEMIVIFVPAEDVRSTMPISRTTTLWPSHRRSRTPDSNDKMLRLAEACDSCIILFGGTSYIVLLGIWSYQLPQKMPAFFGLAYPVFLIGIFFLDRLHQYYPQLTQNLLLSFPSTENPSQLEVDQWAWNFFCFFISILVTCIAGYSLFWDSSGTENPAWTIAFG
jgi:hypothetical protein